MRTYLETASTRLAFAVIPHLPRGAVVRLSRLLGFAGTLFSRRMRRLAMTNLDLAYGDTLSAARKKAIMRNSFQTMSLVLLDTFWYSRDTDARIQATVTFDPCFDLLFKDRPHVVVSAHYGNWEILGMGITARGFPLHSVAKPLKNPEVDALFDDVRNKVGQKIIKRKGAVRSMLRILQQGGKIGVVMDQNTRVSEGGQFFDFFTRPASFATAGAALAIKTQTDMIVCAMIPGRDGSYRGIHCVEVPVKPYLGMASEAAVTALTERMVKELEAIIRARPEYWLWAYKRWKYVPPGWDPALFPYYQRDNE